MTDTELRVRDMIEIVLLREGDDMLGSARLVEDLGVTSLDMFELVTALELEFQLEVSEEVQDAMVTVDDVVRYVDSRIMSC